MAKIGDAITSKLKGRKVETIKVPLETLADMIEELFIVPAVDETTLNELEKAFSWRLINILFSTTRRMETNDGRHELLACMSSGGKRRSYVWVFDDQTGKYFEVEKGKMKAFLKEIKGRITKEKVDRSMGRKTAAIAEAKVINGVDAEALTQLKQLLDQGVITKEEFDLKKSQMLGL